MEGFLVTSRVLDEQWTRLEDFEGEDYERVLKDVLLADGTKRRAFVYVHRAD